MGLGTSAVSRTSMQGGGEGGRRGGGRKGGGKHIGMDIILAFTDPVLFWENRWIFKRK